MSDEKIRIQSGLESYGIDGLFAKLKDFRCQLVVEKRDTVRITLGLLIDEVISEMDRRNQLVLEARLARKTGP